MVKAGVGHGYLMLSESRWVCSGGREKCTDGARMVNFDTGGGSFVTVSGGSMWGRWKKVEGDDFILMWRWVVAECSLAHRPFDEQI